MRLAVVAAVLAPIVVTSPARADDGLGGASVIFARGLALVRTDARGRGETEIAQLPGKVAVRALRSDARGTVLLADLGGKWSWMPLDGHAHTLTELPCADGPAQLAADGTCVLCRSTRDPGGSVIVTLATGKPVPVAVPAPGTRLVGVGAGRRLVWADKAGIWSSPPGDATQQRQVAAEPPLRSFLPSPDGSRAVGVYLDKVFEGAKQTKPAELLMSFALDGQAARRKAIKDGVPIEWSHDNQWVLVQSRGSACVMSAMGGEYKCWKGYTGASIASDGKWALILGDRAKGTPKPEPKQKPRAKQRAKQRAPEDATPEPASEPSNESENRQGDDTASGDVEVPPPTGPLALYRAKLDGAFTESPALIVKVLDGAAVWIPARP